MGKMKMSKIKIKESFLETPPKEKKLQICREHWNKYKCQDRFLVVNEEGYLIDGYVQYLVLKEKGIEIAEVKRRNHLSKRFQRIKESGLSNPRYKNEKTIYIFGKHLNCEKTYVWRVPRSWYDWGLNIQVGDIVSCRTKFGFSPITVERIEILEKCPIDYSVKKVGSKVIRRNGDIVEL